MVRLFTDFDAVFHETHEPDKTKNTADHNSGNRAWRRAPVSRRKENFIKDKLIDHLCSADNFISKLKKTSTDKKETGVHIKLFHPL